jgi:hypothetical protein
MMTMKIVFDSYAVIKVTGTDPEQFLIMFQCSDPAKEGRSFTRASKTLSEVELRAELEEMGLTAVRTEQLIQQAREHPQ